MFTSAFHPVAVSGVPVVAFRIILSFQEVMAFATKYHAIITVDAIGYMDFILIKRIKRTDEYIKGSIIAQTQEIQILANVLL